MSRKVLGSVALVAMLCHWRGSGWDMLRLTHVPDDSVGSST